MLVGKPSVEMIQAQEGGESNDPREYTFRLFSERGFANGNEVDPAGMNIDAYMRNPVMLFSHDMHSPPIGRATRVYKEGNAVYGSFIFDEQDPKAKEIQAKYDGGFMNSVSIGARIKAYRLISEPKEYPPRMESYKERTT